MFTIELRNPTNDIPNNPFEIRLTNAASGPAPTGKNLFITWFWDDDDI